MSIEPTKGSKTEQMICVSCGMCCDGTLFLFANLKPGERGDLPQQMDERSYSDATGDHFRLPCPYFTDRCSIYKNKKAFVCSAFRCQLLTDFSEGRVTPGEAMAIVSDAKRLLENIMIEYCAITGDSTARPFRELLAMIDRPLPGTNSESEQDALVAMCNVFEALMIKNFRSADDFDKMIVT